MPVIAAEKSTESRARIEALINAAFMREVIRRVTDPIVPLSDSGAGAPLYCVHPIGGGATEFQHMARALGPYHKLYAVLVPTDRRNAQFARSIEHISAYHVDELMKFQPEGAFLLAGYSVGATIALEMAHQLIAKGREVRLLIVFDGELLNTGAGISQRNPLYWFKLLLNVPRWIVEEQPVKNRRRLVNKAAARLKSAATRLVKKPRATAHAVERYMNLAAYPLDHVAFIKALYDGHIRYVPRRYPGRVLVFVAKTHPLFHLQQVEAPWKKIAPASELVEIDATHVGIMRMPHALPVAERLRKAIEELGDVTPSPAASLAPSLPALSPRTTPSVPDQGRAPDHDPMPTGWFFAPMLVWSASWLAVSRFAMEAVAPWMTIALPAGEPRDHWE